MALTQDDKFSGDAIKFANYTEQIYNVPAAVTLAQYALESNYGQSRLAKTQSNYFGIKNPKGSGFKTYDSMFSSFLDHGRLLSRPLYADKTKGTTNINEYIDAIAETYAPKSDGNVDYAEKLKNIIKENDLQGKVDSGYTYIPTSEKLEEKTEFNIFGVALKAVVLVSLLIASFYLIYGGVT